MQHMPDKDFDKLFREKFMEAEIEPSADLWGNIADKLEPKKKRGLPLMWMAAASVAVVASVMIFTQGDEKILLRPNAAAMASVSDVDAPNPTQEITVPATVETVVEKTEVAPSTSKYLQAAKSKVAKMVVDADEQKNILASVQPSKTNDHLGIKNDIKRVDPKPLDVVQEEAVAQETKGNKMIAQVDKTKNVDTEYLDPMDESNDNKKGIRNVGDLINFVVDKVDKRDKKIIKFDTDDDDNSSIIGLNIGFLKLNKKNNK